MIKTRPELALKTAIQLTEKAIENPSRLLNPEEVTEYIKTIYDFLVDGNPSS